jgi:hypothetical protein
VWFETLRAQGVKQDDAEREVLETFNISSRSLWSHYQVAEITFCRLPRSAQAFGAGCRIPSRAYGQQNTRHVRRSIKVGALLRALQASGCQAKWAEMYENNSAELNAWLRKIDMDLNCVWLRVASEVTVHMRNRTQKKTWKPARWYLCVEGAICDPRCESS